MIKRLVIVLAMLQPAVLAAPAGETAWGNPPSDVTSTYVYGYVNMPWGLMDDTLKLERPDFDEFAPGPEGRKAEENYWAEVEKRSPAIRPTKLPPCLTPHDGYRDLTTYFHKLGGLDLKPPQWLLCSYGPKAITAPISARHGKTPTLSIKYPAASAAAALPAP